LLSTGAQEVEKVPTKDWEGVTAIGTGAIASGETLVEWHCMGVIIVRGGGKMGGKAKILHSER
jgi:hypothetical protein